LSYINEILLSRMVFRRISKNQIPLISIRWEAICYQSQTDGQRNIMNLKSLILLLWKLLKYTN